MVCSWKKFNFTSESKVFIKSKYFNLFMCGGKSHGAHFMFLSFARSQISIIKKMRLMNKRFMKNALEKTEIEINLSEHMKSVLRFHAQNE